MRSEEQREYLLRLFKQDRFLAHKHLFPHRHKDESPEFHRESIELLNDPDPLVAEMAFRGGAKSTLLEEHVLLKLLYREDDYALFVGPKWEAACEHLEPIRNEIETNDLILELFGDQKSSPWTMDELALANGSKVKAIGAGQSMRGTKSNNERPTLAAIDDLEDESNIATEESRRRTERWLMGTLIPALHPTKGKVRFIGTPIHPKALITKKCQDPKWKSKIFPLLYIDENGQEQSAWPARFPLKWIYELRQQYLESGNLTEFEQEYMCRAEDVAGKPFQANMIQVAPPPHHYLPVEIVVDPAKTTNKRSARTGYAAGSWLGNKLIVRDAQGHFHKPDEIINTIFEWNHRFRPALIGIETNSLEEFIMQPLRARMLSSGISLPLFELRAPKDKDGFIKGLQPFYNAGLVTHAKHLPDLEMELLQFPTGLKDVINAAAYFLRLRAGRTVYQDFNAAHIAPILECSPSAIRWLVMSSRPALTTAALVQIIEGNFRVHKDWVVNKPPQEAFPNIFRDAIMAGEGMLKLGATKEQFDKYTNNGLPAAFKKDNNTATHFAAAVQSEGALKEWLTKREQGDPVFQVSEEAYWVINGLARGYSRRLDKGGSLADAPEDNEYRVLIEGIESFAMWLSKSMIADDNGMPIRYSMTNDGRRYINILPQQR